MAAYSGQTVTSRTFKTSFMRGGRRVETGVCTSTTATPDYIKMDNFSVIEFSVTKAQVAGTILATTDSDATASQNAWVAFNAGGTGVVVEYYVVGY